MKLSENDYIMRSLFSPSFIRIGQELWIFNKWPIFEHGPFLCSSPYFKHIIISNSATNGHGHILFFEPSDCDIKSKKSVL